MSIDIILVEEMCSSCEVWVWAICAELLQEGDESKVILYYGFESFYPLKRARISLTRVRYSHFNFAILYFRTLSIIPFLLVSLIFMLYYLFH